ncbi:IS481 family transposase [Craurococcus roseus]|uniref:IS481 family transposase n=1 Tax=Craurococcus roseus TaxID=77585 RepID=A0ABN1G5J4_9PROT
MKRLEARRELGDAGAVCRRFGISRPTLRKRLRRYDAEGEAGLRERSRRPRRSPAWKAGPAEEELILGLRRDRRLGAKRLRVELRRLHGLRLSPSIIHKVLVRHGLCALPRRARPRHKPKRYSRPVPGDRVQIDTRKIRPGLWQSTAVDDRSRYPVGGLAGGPSAAAALAFLGQVLDEAPFAIQRAQTDRRAGFFADAVQRRLMAETVKFRPVPPRPPHLNGEVERAQRTALEAFWATVEARVPDIGDQLAVRAHHRNWDRPHEALSGACPIAGVCERAAKTPVWAEIDAACDAARERTQVREFAVETALRRLK